MSSKAFMFVKRKLQGFGIKQALFIQFEGFVFWLFGNIPSFPGFLLRNLICFLFFKKKNGFIWIQPFVTLVNSNRISAGKNVGINSGTYINAIGGIELGDFVLIGSNVTISSGQHPIDGIHPTVFERPVVPKKIVIEEGVWIGAGAVIMPGITVRRGTVIGANAVVTKDTTEYSVMVGIPAKQIRDRKMSR
jgi:maltose O-acetyltransferase